MLAGPKDFISQAVRCRKALGGGLRQAGVLAAAGKLSLLKMVDRLEEDHSNAKTFARGDRLAPVYRHMPTLWLRSHVRLSFLPSALQNCDPPLFAIDMDTVETNILRFRLQNSTLTPPEFCALMAQVGEGEEDALGQGIRVLMYPHYENSVRAVWHLGVSSEDTQLAIQKLQFVASQNRKNKL